MSDESRTMHIRVLTLFPDMIREVVHTSMLGRAVSAGILDVEAVDIRDYADNAYRKVDDAMFGGGTGMIGDPSGKTDMRKMLTLDDINYNISCFKKQMSRFIEFGPDKARITSV